MNLQDNHLDTYTYRFGDQSLGPRANETIFKKCARVYQQTRRFRA